MIDGKIVMSLCESNKQSNIIYHIR